MCVRVFLNFGFWITFLKDKKGKLIVTQTISIQETHLRKFPVKRKEESKLRVDTC